MRPIILTFHFVSCFGNATKRTCKFVLLKLVANILQNLNLLPTILRMSCEQVASSFTVSIGLFAPADWLEKRVYLYYLVPHCLKLAILLQIDDWVFPSGVILVFLDDFDRLSFDNLLFEFDLIFQSVYLQFVAVVG